MQKLNIDRPVAGVELDVQEIEGDDQGSVGLLEHFDIQRVQGTWRVLVRGLRTTVDRRLRNLRTSRRQEFGGRAGQGLLALHD
jgi:hypothetical protein